MIITDANIWIDHFRRGDVLLRRLLVRREIRLHPFTIGEIALGNLSDRTETLAMLHIVPACPVAMPNEVLALMDADGLAGTGIGYVDTHLLASARLMPGYRLWTRDRRLHAQAERLGVAFSEPAARAH